MAACPCDSWLAPCTDRCVVHAVIFTCLSDGLLDKSTLLVTQTEENLADAVAKKHTHANATELDKIADGDKAKWDAMEQNAKDYADGLAVNYDAAGSADEAEAAAKEYTDTALTWGSF